MRFQSSAAHSQGYAAEIVQVRRTILGIQPVFGVPGGILDTRRRNYRYLVCENRGKALMGADPTTLKCCIYLQVVSYPRACSI
jgi:hypothetical protein